SAGGRREHYATFGETLDDATDYVAWANFAIDFNVGAFTALINEYGEDLWIDKVDKQIYGTDFLAKPTLLLGNHDNGYWRTLEEAALETLLMQGSDAFWESNNTGVYKNFALGYGGVAIPPHLRENPSATVGSAFVVAVDAFNTLGLFAEANYHLVVGRLGGRDFWEVVPKHLFNG